MFEFLKILFKMALKFSSKLFKNKEIYLKTLSCGAAAQALAKQKSYADIPGPKPMPFVGNIFNLKQFGKLILRYFSSSESI